MTTEDDFRENLKEQTLCNGVVDHFRKVTGPMIRNIINEICGQDEDVRKMEFGMAVERGCLVPSRWCANGSWVCMPPTARWN